MDKLEKDELLKDGERIDEIGFGNLRLIQKPEDFCYGIDAVLLATFAEIRGDARVIDLGTGTGIIPMILSHRTEASEIVGVEIQQDSYERGLRNVFLNDLGKRVRMIHGDVKHLIKEKKVKTAATPMKSCGCTRDETRRLPRTPIKKACWAQQALFSFSAKIRCYVRLFKVSVIHRYSQHTRFCHESSLRSLRYRRKYTRVHTFLKECSLRQHRFQ
jgi:hypothetical protein